MNGSRSGSKKAEKFLCKKVPAVTFPQTLLTTQFTLSANQLLSDLCLDSSIPSSVSSAPCPTFSDNNSKRISLTILRAPANK